MFKLALLVGLLGSSGAYASAFVYECAISINDSFVGKSEFASIGNGDTSTVSEDLRYELKLTEKVGMIAALKLVDRESNTSVSYVDYGAQLDSATIILEVSGEAPVEASCWRFETP